MKKALTSHPEVCPFPPPTFHQYPKETNIKRKQKFPDGVAPYVTQADDREERRESDRGGPGPRGRGRGRGGGFAARGFAAAGLTRQQAQAQSQGQGEKKDGE